MASTKSMPPETSLRRRKLAGWLLVWAVAAIFAWKMAFVTWHHAVQTYPIDFYYFWDAATNTVRGDPAQAYVAHETPATRLEALAYPPPFLLLIAPLGLAGFAPALIIWIGVTGLLFLFAARQPLRLAFAHPPAAYNVHFGQTGFLTAAIFLGGAYLLKRRPIAAGAIIGLSVVKPQLAVLFPVALIANRQWGALAAAAASSLALIAFAGILFGPGIYADWWAAMTQYGGWLVAGFRVIPWHTFVTPYGFIRMCGAGSAVAFIGHAAVAGWALYITFRAWRDDWESRVAVLAAAAILVPPYLFVYDAVILVVPLGWFAARDSRKALLLWLLLLMPLLTTTFVNSSFLPFKVADLPNSIPIAAVLALCWLWLERGREG